MGVSVPRTHLWPVWLWAICVACGSFWAQPEKREVMLVRPPNSSKWLKAVGTFMQQNKHRGDIVTLVRSLQWAVCKRVIFVPCGPEGRRWSQWTETQGGAFQPVTSSRWFKDEIDCLRRQWVLSHSECSDMVPMTTWWECCRRKSVIRWAVEPDGPWFEHIALTWTKRQTNEKKTLRDSKSKEPQTDRRPMRYFGFWRSESRDEPAAEERGGGSVQYAGSSGRNSVCRGVCGLVGFNRKEPLSLLVVWIRFWGLIVTG